MDLQQQIDKLTNQLAQKKAQKLLKEQALKQRESVKARKERNRKIYQIGGMVEKMGLDGLDEKLFLGVLLKAYRSLKIATADNIEQLKNDGADFLPTGKKLEKISR